MEQRRRVCVFCASHIGRNPRFSKIAAEVGSGLAQRGVGLVYGGGSVGLMGVVADAALAAGGEVDGVIPTGLFSREVAHTGLTRLHPVASMHERKALMFRLSDAFVALPGGLGTFDELVEIATWAQLGIHGKPIGVIDPDGYFDGLWALLDRAVDDGFLAAEQRSRLVVTTEPAAMLDTLLDTLLGPQPGPLS